MSQYGLVICLSCCKQGWVHPYFDDSILLTHRGLGNKLPLDSLMYTLVPGCFEIVLPVQIHCLWCAGKCCYRISQLAVVRWIIQLQCRGNWRPACRARVTASTVRPLQCLAQQPIYTCFDMLAVLKTIQLHQRDKTHGTRECRHDLMDRS